MDDLHRIVVVLEKISQGIEGLRVGCKATEKVNNILVAHGRLNHVKRARLQRWVWSASQTATYELVSSPAVLGRK